MPTVEQTWDGLRWGSDSGAVRYRVCDTTDYASALAALAAATAPILGGMVRQSVEVEQVEGTDDEWDGEVTYAVRDQKEPQTGESSISFDTTGGSQHITQALATWRFGIGEEDPGDLKGAIGWDGEQVQGCDITVPQFSFSETHYLPIAAVTNAYVRNLAIMTGRTNLSPFRSFAAGEVLFLGARGQRRGNDDWEITFGFAVSPNAAGLTIGEIAGICKWGWDYLWVRYSASEDAAGKKLVPKPVGVYVEQVYWPGDFALLGIGA